MEGMEWKREGGVEIEVEEGSTGWVMIIRTRLEEKRRRKELSVEEKRAKERGQGRRDKTREDRVGETRRMRTG
jgi:hypothetical protein